MAKVQTTINAIFSDATRAAAKDTFTATVTVENQWLNLGTLVRKDVKDAKALDKVRPEVIRGLIYANLPDVTVDGQTFTALAVEDYHIPRKNTAEHKAASATEQKFWLLMHKAKAGVRGTGSTYYGRIRKYGYDEEYVNPEAAQKKKEAAKKKAKKAKKAKPSQKIAAMITTIIAALQKIEAPDFVVKSVLDPLETAQKAALAGIAKK